MIRFPRSMTLAAMAALAMLLAGPTVAQTKEPLKIGFVYVSPIGDAGWTFQHDTGRKEMEKALAGKVTTKYVESVPEGADAERVIRDLAQSGNTLIFTTSFGYMNPTIKVATAFPNVAFEHATGYKTAKNVGIYNARFYEGRYLAGIVAGKMSKTGVAGYVAAFPIPEVVMGINAFARGMRSVNPKAEVKVIWTNSWFDPGRESEASNTLISQGADVVFAAAGQTGIGTFNACQESKKALFIGVDTDQFLTLTNPGDTILTSAVKRIDVAVFDVVKKALDGKFPGGQNLTYGLVEDGVGLSPFHDFDPKVPQAIKDAVTKAIADIKAGTVTVPETVK